MGAGKWREEEEESADQLEMNGGLMSVWVEGTGGDSLVILGTKHKWICFFQTFITSKFKHTMDMEF